MKKETLKHLLSTMTEDDIDNVIDAIEYIDHEEQEMPEEEYKAEYERISKLSEEEVKEELQQMVDKFKAAQETKAKLFGGINDDQPCPCGSGKKYSECCKAELEEWANNVTPQEFNKLLAKMKIKKIEK